MKVYVVSGDGLLEVLESVTQTHFSNVPVQYVLFFFFDVFLSGLSVANAVHKAFPIAEQKSARSAQILVVCGPGNNGEYWCFCR